METNDDIDLDDTECIVSIINIFQLYYKKLYKKSDDETIFDDINYDDDTSTNRSMELLYEYMYEYRINKQKDNKLVDIYDENIINAHCYEQLYGLIIDDKIQKISPSFLPLLMYLVELKWTEIDWKISKIKGE